MNLLDGAVDGDGAFVAGGAPATAFPLAVRRSLAGQRVTLGVRPEAVRLVPPTAQGTVAAVVEFVEELGAGRVVHASLAGHPFAVATAEPVALSPGEPVGVAFDPGAAHFFSGDEGLRLDDAAVSWQAAAA
jgi:sn-glycerol 3-phosphate transport system ATP-binding protein